MKELPIDDILAALEKPSTGKNINEIMQALSKADEVLKQIEVLMTRLDRMGLKPLLVRGLGVKLGIDAESPLKSDFRSPTHAKVMEGLNMLSEDELKTQLEAQTYGKGKTVKDS